MNKLTSGRRSATAGLLCAILIMFLAAQATTQIVAPRASAAAPSAPHTTATRYLYSGTFTFNATNDVLIDFPGDNDETRHIKASLTGTLPLVQVTEGQRLDPVLASVATSVHVTSANAKVVSRTNDGANTTTCTGTATKVIGRPWLAALLMSTQLHAYSQLQFPTSCVSTEAGDLGTTTYAFGPMGADLTAATGVVGDPSIAYTIKDDAATSLAPDASCPGEYTLPGSTCSFKIDGKLTLKLIKKIEPPKKPAKKPAKATIGKGAKKVSAKVPCPAARACTVTIRVTPLRGGPTLTVKKLTVKPGKTKSLSMKIPKKKRAAVKRAGGVTVKFTYRSAGSKASSQTRRARL
ncbi:hypothetical protein [Rarobacter faecitabidus]|uniref:Ig-like domain-containing protein n=1 Tax=Rarobacter faecitabidus TaxID=13243 RepID=A0A542ZTY6_RARFA|nr:hypothetical protein [Rarobacter faecitabidus]TQL63812.1 hypothetical protein FB461_0290 [Rarobacter faecitabidus]